MRPRLLFYVPLLSFLVALVLGGCSDARRTADTETAGATEQAVHANPIVWNPILAMPSLELAACRSSSNCRPWALNAIWSAFRARC